MVGQESDRQKNRMLGIALASTAVTIFLTVFAVVALFRYAEAHHLLAAM